MDLIRVSKSGRGFENSRTGAPFVPVGSNYCGVIEKGPGDAGYFGQVFPLFGTDEHTESDGVAEARRAFKRLADLGLNVVRTWLEADLLFPLGLRLDPHGIEKVDRLLDIARETGIYLSLGWHLAPLAAHSIVRNFEPPHRQRQIQQIALLAQRYKDRPEIFSWTLIGEGTLPWQTGEMAEQWRSWLTYWYDDDLKALREAWEPHVEIESIDTAPVPQRNLAATQNLIECIPILEKTDDPLAGSTWRYDWRLFLEEIGSGLVHEQARTIRSAGAKQMITVGNNSWTFPDLPAGMMATGYNPYFYLDSVDYVCQHNYPAPQTIPGSMGDPLDSDEAMTYWLTANEIMGRIYASMGKPVMLEEWGWYGGGESRFLTPLPYRSEEDQMRYCDQMMDTSRGAFAGWIYWQWRDMPRAVDITNFSGLYDASGKRPKPWGKRYADWASRLQSHPPTYAPAKATVPLPMKELYTSDAFHQKWWRETIAAYAETGPLDFDPVFEIKPMMKNLREAR